MSRTRFLGVYWLMSFIMLICLSSNAYSSPIDQVWSDETQAQHKSRSFAHAYHEDGVWVLNLYQQEYGQYQEIVQSHSFSDFGELENFRKTQYPALRPIDVLGHWPIIHIDSHKKQNEYLWQVKEDWSEQWESRYSRWIQDEVQADFFNRNGLATDCADVLVGLRWIFARIHGLPVASTIAATGDLFTQESVLRSWRRLDRASSWNQDQLFMTALNYIMGVTSTRTLIRDAYPVSLTQEGLIAGSFILTLGEESNHVKLISENHFNDPSEIPLYTLSSTTPRSRKDMVREAMLDEEWPKKGAKNFFALRKPVRTSKGWRLQESSSHNNYSQEQYDEDLRSANPSFIDFLLKRLKPEFSPRRIIEIGITELKEYLEMRADVVVKGYEYCKTHNCAQGTGAWDDWSTPSRDHKIAVKFDNYEVMLGRYEDLYPGLLQNWKNSLKSAFVELFGEDVPLSAVRYIWREGLYSSDPALEPQVRWGLEYDSFFKQVLTDLKDLLKQRDATFERIPNHCDLSSCYPKNSLWLSLNTYHDDQEILKLNSRMRSYCSELATNGCKESRSRTLSQLIKTSYKTLSAYEWLKKSTSFASDPTLGLNQRWGSAEIDGLDLERFDSIKIATNSRALVDQSQLIDLSDASLLARAGVTQRMLLTKMGLAILTPKSGNILKILGASSLAWSELEILGLAEGYDWNQVRLEDYNTGSVLIIPGALNTKNLVIFEKNQQARQIQIQSDFVRVSEFGAIFQQQSGEISFVELDMGRIYRIKIGSGKIKNPHFIELYGRSGQTLIGQYSDQNEDRYFPVIIDLDSRELMIGNSLAAQSKLIYYNSDKRIGAVEVNFNSEFPEVYAISLKNLEVVKTNFLGNIVSALSHDYLLIGKGGRWDHDFDRTLYHATQSGLEIAMKDSDSLKIMDLAGSYVLRMKRNQDVGELVSLDNGMRTTRMGADMRLGHQETQKSLLMKTSDQKVILSRFTSYFGDYFGYGQIYLDKENTGVALIGTSAFAKRDEDEGNLQWEKKFQAFKIYSGTLISTGVGLATWIAPIH